MANNLRRPEFGRSQPETLLEVLVGRAATGPERPAFRFLGDGESPETTITYAELDRQARNIAAHLQEQAKPGGRALLLYQPGLAYIAGFFGCIYAGLIPVPAYPPTRNRLGRHTARLPHLLRDSEPALVLTTLDLQPQISRLLSDFPVAGRCLATDVLPAVSGWSLPALNRHSTALLQYTSGSLGNPKGVVLTHSNLLCNLEQIRQVFELTPDGSGVLWLPPYHDMGLIGGILEPVYAGFPVTLMSPFAFLQRPYRWLEAISRYRADYSGGPDFAYRYCVERLSAEQRRSLDLSSWKLAFTGAEPVRPATLRLFAQTFAESGFRPAAFLPCYGLAEATLLVSGAKSSSTPLKVDATALRQNRVKPAIPDEPPLELVSCGSPAPGTEIIIVDPEDLTECASDRVGEIWLSGDSIAGGYYNLPAENREIFGATPANRPGETFLRTGDLGFFHRDELYVTGRLKDLVIIRGQNHYPQDLEDTALCNPAIKGAAAFSIETERGEEAALVVEVSRHFPPEKYLQLMEDLRREIASRHALMIGLVALINQGKILRTSSGKVQRRACREALVAGELETLADSRFDINERNSPETAFLETGDRAGLEEFIGREIAAITGLEAAVVRPDTDLLTAGLDSLAITSLLFKLENITGLELSLSELPESLTVTGLAELLETAFLARPSISETQSNKYKPTEGQRALYFLHALDKTSSAYHIARALKLTGPFQVENFRLALKGLVLRHPVLRTVYPDAQTALILDEPAFRFEVRHLAANERLEIAELLSSEASRPFELETGPILRVTIFKLSETENILLLVVHHIAADYHTLVIILEELLADYWALMQNAPSETKPPEAGLPEYAQRHRLESREAQNSEAYWREALANPPPPLPFLNSPRKQTGKVSRHSEWLGPVLTGSLKAFSDRHHLTLFGTLLALFQLLLAKYADYDEVITGTPADTRSHARFAGLTGYLVNLLPLRANLADNPSFEDFARQVNRNARRALKHRDYPFNLMPKERGQELIQALFTFYPSRADGLNYLALNESGYKFNRAGLELETLAVPELHPQYHLALFAAGLSGDLRLVLHYETGRLDEQVSGKILEHFRQLAERAVSTPESPVFELSYLPEHELELLNIWEGATPPKEPRPTVIELFRAQVRKKPEAWAVLSAGTRLIYRELDELSNGIAHLLREQGMGPEKRVALLVERAEWLVPALLGILKAGAAYLPLDERFPAERLRYLLEDSRAGLVLASRKLAGLLPHLTIPVRVLEEMNINRSPEAPAVPVFPENLAYIIYTSGSTGQPKGVEVTHRSLSALLAWGSTIYSADQLSGVLASTALTFDLSVFEIFQTLSAGGIVIHVSGGLDEISPDLAEKVTLVNTVPSVMREWLTLGRMFPNAATVNLAGEPLPAALVKDLYRLPQVKEVYNLYGPTEDTVYSTWVKALPQPEMAPPIGRPINETSVYVLDGHLNRVAPGLPGELYLGGAGLARGYLGKPALTAGRFLPDPFSGQPGARMYRTGDQVRFNSDGNLEYLGRLDRQLKVRGFRVETAEVELALENHPSIEKAIVLINPDKPDTLIAYMVAPGLRVAEIRRFLATHLPNYMIPSVFIFLEKFPLTPNGKLDKTALPRPERRSDTAGPPPASDMEKMVAEVWCELLEIREPHLTDNFFELGGHSLLAAQVVAALRARLMIEIPVGVAFEYQNLGELARHLEELQWHELELLGVEQLLAELEEMPEEEVLERLKEYESEK
jgi:amino acid adenylation domain-containing protein